MDLMEYSGIQYFPNLFDPGTFWGSMREALEENKKSHFSINDAFKYLDS